MPQVQAKPEVPKQEAPDNRVDVRLMKPGKYETTPDMTFVLDIYLRKKDNRWILADGPGKDVDHESVTFRMWSYDEMIGMRKMATTYDQIKRIHMIDHDALNQLKIQRLMIEWTFGRDNPRLKLFHVSGVLVDEGWNAFRRLQPNIISFIFDRMNRVYELNA